ncbi:UMP kinase [Candidatus Woesearchaeota archaeon]|jgi:uridylate kinase|nr:UMP kinase [Candidatus Woesearchaeota archaeon]MBT7237267.1 UMP kinase [Candidatus Woesearchaeota archaeon]
MKKVVISLGGSIIIPDKVDYGYLKKFSKFIKKFSKKNKVVIVTGGGSTARKYIDGMKHINSNPDMLSIVGIASTRLNARLVSGVFDIKDEIPEKLLDVKKFLRKRNLVICGALGMQKNMTSDGNAAEVAELIKADYLINMTNVKGLYDKNPKTNKSAKFIPEISFKDFMTRINKIKFKAGQHFVLDQSAAKIISRSKIKTCIVNNDLKNLNKLLNEKKFVGTVIGDV